MDVSWETSVRKLTTVRRWRLLREECVRSMTLPRVKIVEADRNTDKLEDSALNLERRKIKREEGAKAAKALESLDVKPAEEMKGADVDLIVSIAGRRRCDRGLGGYLSIVRVQLGCGVYRAAASFLSFKLTSR